MQTDLDEGRSGPRKTAVCAVFLFIVGIFPSTMFAWGSGRTIDMAARELLLPVMRPAMAATDEGILRGNGVLGDEGRIVAEAFDLDARSIIDLFQSRDYHIDQVRTGALPVPRLVLSDLPTNLKTLDSSDDRKAVFVKTLLPLILLTNEQIEKDRTRLQRLQALRTSGKGLAQPDRVWLAEIASRYGMRAEDEVNIKSLLQRVDIVPASLALAQAAEESGWGTSRFAQKGNALYGQLTWNAEHEGIVPRNRRPGETHRFRAFEDPKASIESYIHNLNTHRAYASFRQMRAGLRSQGKPLDGGQLATALVAYSERGSDYVRTIRSLIRMNSLGDFDNAVLRDEAMVRIVRPETEPVQASLTR